MAKGIYKRGNILWIAYVGPDGKVIRESSKSSKVKDAQTLLTKRRRTVLEGKMPEIKRIANYNFKQLVDDYLKWAERQRAFAQKKFVINQLKDRFGSLPLRRFDTRTIEGYQSERLLAGKPKPNSEEAKANKPATINRHIATLKHMFTKAVEWDMVEEEVLKRIRRVKLLEENNRRLRYLSKEECNALVQACENHLKPIVITALNTGMRKGEILSLTWDNLDLRHGFILLDRTKNGERREIPINETLRTVLSGLVRRLDTPYVFYNSDTGTRYVNLHKPFQAALKRARIKDFKFHDLRHTFASHLVMAGVDITTVRELLGHKTLTMTLRYAHLAPSHKVKAVNILDDSLTLSPTSQKLHKKEGVTNG